jgi:hypothetical protein
VTSVSATGHQHTEIQKKMEATCTTKGYTGDIYCKDCKKVIQKGTVKDKIGHTYTSKVTKEATCLVNGQRTYTCKKCGQKKTKSIKKLTASATLTKTSVSIVVGKSTTDAYVKKMTKGDYVKFFMSSNENIVKVSGKQTGTCTIKGIKVGSAKITLKFASGLTKKITVKVKDVTCTKISGLKSSISLNVKKTVKLTPTITPKNCTQKVTYSSSNMKIAKVSPKGVITGVQKGTCKIYVKCGSKKVTVKVTVK